MAFQKSHLRIEGYLIMEYIFFCSLPLHFTNVDHGFNGGVTSHRQGWCTLCLCCHFATSCITLAGWEQTLECGETNAGWTWLPRKTPPTMMSHVAAGCVGVFIVLSFGSAMYCGSYFSKGAEAHSNASGNWSCADVYSAARTNSSVTWPCKRSHSNCIQLEYENLKSLRSAPFGDRDFQWLFFQATFSTWATRGCYQGASIWDCHSGVGMLGMCHPLTGSNGSSDEHQRITCTGGLCHGPFLGEQKSCETKKPLIDKVQYPG